MFPTKTQRTQNFLSVLCVFVGNILNYLIYSFNFEPRKTYLE